MPLHDELPGAAAISCGTYSVNTCIHQQMRLHQVWVALRERRFQLGNCFRNVLLQRGHRNRRCISQRNQPLLGHLPHKSNENTF